MSAAGTFALAFTAAAASTFVLARIAERFAWVDAASDAPDRKQQARPVPPVGGAAIGLALCVAILVDPGALPEFSSPWTRAALAIAFAVGLADDLAPRGLSPLSKLAGQVAAGAVLAAPAWSSDAREALLVAALAVAAQNALNTFDNADGAAASVAACGFALGHPTALAATLGFLPFNLWLGRSARAYLGDSGSHLLGVALVTSLPHGMAALYLPALDLARVSVVRIARGIPPWVGDRRHLAHRLQVAGLGRTAVALTLAGIAAPAIVGSALGGEAFLVVGVAVTTVAFIAAVVATPSSS